MKRTVLMVLLGFLLMVGLLWNSYQRAWKEAYTNEYEAAARQLRVEREEIRQELERVTDDLKRVTLGRSAAGFLFVELDEMIFTSAYATLEEQGFTATLALSPDFLPDTEGNLTLGQFQFLLGQGWSTCIRWDPARPLADYAAEMKTALDELGVAFPDVLYVDKGDYSRLTEEEILSAGFTTVIHHGESGTVIAREDDGELFRLTSVPWNGDGVRGVLQELLDYGGSVLFLMDFSTSAGCYEPTMLENMCVQLHKYSEQLRMTDPTGLRENLQGVRSDGYLLARKAYLEAELARYDQEIDAVFDMEFE